MRMWLYAAVALAGGGVLGSQAPAPTDWVDAATGHRVVRLTDDGGGSTLYFHDNAFSPEGDKLMFNTPGGIAVVEVAKIGTPAARAGDRRAGARGGYFARRSREILQHAGNAAGAASKPTTSTRGRRGRCRTRAG